MFDEKPEAQQRAELTAEQGIDSLRRALSISDEIAREYRAEVERLEALIDGLAILPRMALDDWIMERWKAKVRALAATPEQTDRKSVV